MPTNLSISANDYYDMLPVGTHATGDIWSNLPTFGLLNARTTTGIVITPACDLAQCKAETLTYLPIVPLADYVASSAFFFETWKATHETLSKLQPAVQVTAAHRFELPAIPEIEAAIDEIAGMLKNKPDDSKQALLERLKEYRLYIEDIISNRKPSLARIEKIISKAKFEKSLTALVTNAFKADLHFLPADGRRAGFSAIKTNSAVLFRYPLTIPVSILDSAQLCDHEGWASTRNDLAKANPIAAHFDGWPLKLSRLKDDFLSDLLSRYLAMYIRLGSRDFTEDDVNQIVGQMRISV